MKKRPTSVTVIGWLLIIISILSLIGSVMAFNNPISQELMARSPIPMSLQFLMLYGGLAI